MYSLTSSDFIIILLEKDVPKDIFNYEGHKTFPKVFWDVRTSSNATFFEQTK